MDIPLKTMTYEFLIKKSPILRVFYWQFAIPTGRVVLGFLE